VKGPISVQDAADGVLARHNGALNSARMVFLDRLLPAWRHKDPEVRASAVRELGQDSRHVLALVARSDSDVRVRHIAVKKIDDADLLLEIGRSAYDPAGHL
jgi:hypothetical protein